MFFFEWRKKMSGIRYEGNKSAFYKKVRHLIPKNITYYVDPFCGGLGFLQSMLNDGFNFKSIHINDTNNFLYYLYNYLLNDGSRNKLIDMVENTVVSEKNFKKYKIYIEEIKQENKEEIKIKDVYRWLYIVYMGVYNNVFRNELGSNNKKNLLLSLKNTLRVENIIISNKEALEFSKSLVIKKDGGKSRGEKILFFIDPPYINTKTSCYNTNNITLEYIENIINIILEKNKYIKIMFTYNKNEEIEKILLNKGFEILDILTSRNNMRAGKEICAINYNIEEKENLTLF